MKLYRSVFETKFIVFFAFIKSLVQVYIQRENLFEYMITVLDITNLLTVSIILELVFISFLI